MCQKQDKDRIYTFLKSFFQFYLDTVDIQHRASLRCAMCWFDTLILIYCKVITPVALANISIMSHNYYFFSVVRTLKIYSPSKLHVYNTVLWATITKLYLKSPEFIHLITGSLYSLTNISISLPYPQPLVNTILSSFEFGLVFFLIFIYLFFWVRFF